MPDQIELEFFQMDPLPKRKIWLPSLGHIVVMGIILVGGAIAIPGLQSSSRAERERNASTALKTLTSAEADFRANDRDGNQVNDFWTGDASGLYYVKPKGSITPIRLIEESLANADSKPVFLLPTGSGPRNGYRYQALDQDDSVEGEKAIYRIDTDHSGRKVHHLEMFGFIAIPADKSQGKYMFMVNENNTIFRSRATEPRTTWPSDMELKQLTCQEED